nr:MAG TPA: hypothetical protein [Caudoviricetes sp.]
MIPRCPKTCRNITPYPHKKKERALRPLFVVVGLKLNDLRVCTLVQRCNFCICVKILEKFVDNVFHGLKGIKRE